MTVNGSPGESWCISCFLFPATPFQMQGKLGVADMLMAFDAMYLLRLPKVAAVIQKSLGITLGFLLQLQVAVATTGVLNGRSRLPNQSI
jgi:hypothetical protein